MAKVQGIGGIFFKSKDASALNAWYEKHLGFTIQSWGGAQFFWRTENDGERAYTVWSPFAASTTYFAPSDKPYMVNLRVDRLEELLAQLRAEGIEVLDRYEATEQGKFGYVLDPDGTLLELWEPAADDPSSL